MKKLFQILALILVCCSYATGMAKDKPKWTEGEFNDLKNSYIKTAYGEGYTIGDARQKAVNEVLGARSYEAGERISIETESDGRYILKRNDDLTVKMRVIDEYDEYNNGMYRVYVLAQVAKNPKFDYEPVQVTEKYPFSASVFIPGMAQIKKGSTGKGIFFIAAETVFVGGIVAAECLRADYVSKANNSVDLSKRQSYADDANNWQNIRNVAIAGAAAIYVWNVIDGIVAKGKRHVEIGKGRYVSYTPFATPDVAGISLCLNF